MSRILIVEDDPTAVKLLKILLEEVHGFQVTIARRGSEVVEAADKEHPDLFLVDYHLMDMTGVDLIRTLRSKEQYAKTPIVMVSGLDVADEAIKAGANQFMTKPYEPDDLATLFRKLTTPVPQEKPASDGAPPATPPAIPAAGSGAPASKPT